jgi:hypothetical protein
MTRIRGHPGETKPLKMKGWVMVSSDGYASDEDLFEWIQRGVLYASFLPPK